MKRVFPLFAGLVFACLALLFSGCQKPPPPAPTLVAAPHYKLGAPYEAGGTWYYPQETYRLDTSGLATVDDRSGGLTADGELRDPGAMEAAMQTIQLPAIVEVTNLENGLQTDLRVNDRGPASPARIIALSPRAAQLLQIPRNAAARVRVRVEEVPSHRAVDQLGGGPKLAISAAPRASITEEALGPPGAATNGPARVIGGVVPEAAQPHVAERLPEALRRTTAEPGQLYLQCDSFQRPRYAREIAATLSGLGASVLRSTEDRQTRFSVRAGPFGSVAQADAALQEALRRGVIDARIVVD